MLADDEDGTDKTVDRDEMARAERVEPGSATVTARTVPMPLRILSPAGSDAAITVSDAAITVSDAAITVSGDDPFVSMSTVIPLPPVRDGYDAEGSYADQSGEIGFTFRSPESQSWEHEERGFYCSGVAKRTTPLVDPQVVALKKLARKVGFRQLRSLFRSELKDQFAADPTLGFFEYQRRRDEIGRLGRGAIDTQELETAELVQSARNAFSGKDDAEREIDLVQWGPFVLSDTGSVRFGVADARNVTGGVRIASDDDQALRRKGQSIFCDTTYEVDTDLKFRPDVLAAFQGDGAEALGKVTATVGIDFLTPILSQRYMTAELELSHDAGDEGTGFFVNFIIYGR